MIPQFVGVLVHDAWAPYDTYSHLTHALCNAHALRELQAVTDASPGGHWCWAAQAADALREMKRIADASLTIDGTLEHADQQKLASARHRYHSAVLLGKNQAAARADAIMRKHHALARRLLAREDDYLRFTTAPASPLTTTQPNAKSACPSCGSRSPAGMRSMTGAENFCAIRS